MDKLYKMFISLLVCILPYVAGIESLKAGEYSKAAEEFTQSIEDEMFLTDSYRGLGISLWEEQDYEGAYSAFENALALGSEKTATIYSLMGNCAMQMEDYGKAIENYELGLTMEDASDELKKEMEYNLIAAYEYAGDIEKAKEQIARYLTDYPEDESAVKEAGFLETR